MRNGALRLKSLPGIRRESPLEAEFSRQIRSAHLPDPERNAHFLPDRKFEADYLWRSARLVVEVQGNVHRIKARFYSDCEKLCMAQLEGFTILPFSRNEIMSLRGLAWVTDFLKSRSDAR